MLFYHHVGKDGSSILIAKYLDGMTANIIGYLYLKTIYMDLPFSRQRYSTLCHRWAIVFTPEIEQPLDNNGLNTQLTLSLRLPWSPCRSGFSFFQKMVVRDAHLTVLKSCVIYGWRGHMSGQNMGNTISPSDSLDLGASSKFVIC